MWVFDFFLWKTDAYDSPASARSSARSRSASTMANLRATCINDTYTRFFPYVPFLSFSLFCNTLGFFLFFSNSFITALSLSYLIISFPRFLQLQFVLRPGSTRFRYQGYRDFIPRLPISMLVDYDLFAKSSFPLLARSFSIIVRNSSHRLNSIDF